MNNFPKAVRSNGLSSLKMLNKTGVKFCFVCGLDWGGEWILWGFFCFFLNLDFC